MRVKNNNIEMICSLSPLQEGILYHYLADESKTDYVVQYVFKCNGSLNQNLIRKTLEILSRKYEVLRSAISYKKLSKPRQIVLSNREIEFQYYDISDEFNEIQINDINRGFDLQKDSLLRVTLIKVNDYEYKLLWTFHHIILDGWSVGLILKDFLICYSKFTEGYEVKDIEFELNQRKNEETSFKEYKNWLEKQNTDDQLNFWSDILEGYDNTITISPTQVPKKSTINVKRNKKKLDLRIVEEVKKICSNEMITLSSLLECIWGITLQKYNYCDDVVFGEVISGREGNIHNVDSLVGLLINTIPVRVTTRNNEEFIQLVKRHQKTYIDKSQYSLCSLAEIQNKANISNKSIRTLFVFENYFIDYKKFNDTANPFQIELETAREETSYDLTLSASEQDNTINFDLLFNPNKYTNEDIERILTYMENIIYQIVGNYHITISEIELISNFDKELILKNFSGIQSTKVSQHTIVELFESIVKNNKNTVAIKYKNKSYTYDEINSLANSLANELINRGIKKNNLVAIIANRDIWTIIGMIAILKAGGGYVPIDPMYPLERIRYIIEDTNPFAILGNTKLQAIDVPFINISSFKFNKSVKNPIINVKADNLAYAIYSSGTSGTPKGILICHRSVVRLVHQNNFLNLNTSTVILQTGSLSFDASTFEIWGALLNGGTLVLSSEDSLSNTNILKELILEENVNTMWMTSTLFNQVVSIDYHVFDTIKNLIIGGEKLSEYFVKLFKNKNHFTRLMNGYGPTENTTFTTMYEIGETFTKIPIGKPISGTQIYILNNNSVCGIGVMGELCTTGEGVSNGYINLPELTSEKFINNPFGDGKMYRTGDIAKWLPDGNIEYVSRIDDQVKIRGFRIELQEVESIIRNIDGVIDAVALVREKNIEEKELVAYYISKNITGEEIKNIMLSSVPNYLIPDVFIPVIKIPLTINGKLDKKNLLRIKEDRVSEIEPPITEKESIICKFFKEILNVDNVGRKDDFIDLGGHSLRIVKLINAIEKNLGVRISIKDVFENSTVEQLSLFISKTIDSNFSLKKANQKDYYSATPQQKNLYYLCKKNPESTLYNIPNLFLLRGSVDEAKIKEIFLKVVDNNEILRTDFLELNGCLFQRIHSKIEIDFEFSNITHSLEMHEIKDLISSFDLNKGPLFRVKLMKLDTLTSFLFIDIHHIISDGISIQLLMNQLATLYNECEIERSEFQYKDYSEWLNSVDLKEDYNYWKKELCDEIPVLNFPIDKVRPKFQQYNGETISGIINFDLRKKISNLAKITHTTDFIILLSSIMILLSKYSHQKDITVGIPSNGRISKDLENILGMFVNTLPIRENILEDQNFIYILKQIKSRCLGAYNHQLYSIDKMLEVCNIEQDLSRNPLFSVMVTMQEIENISINDGLDIERVKIDSGISKFDLSFHINKNNNNEIFYDIEYATSLFEKESIDLLNHRFVEILNSLVSNPYKKLAEISLCDKIEQFELFNKLNDTEISFRIDKTVLDLFEEIAQKYSNLTAIDDGDVCLSYGELKKYIDFYAFFLKNKGIKPGDFVALYLENSIEMLIAIYAVMKNGAAYVPIDMNYPISRVKYIVKNCNPKFIISNREIKTNIAKLDINIKDLKYSQKNFLSKANPNLTAYVMYTSGTTGDPKGVQVAHRSLMNYIEYTLESYFKGQQVIPLFTNYCFDLTNTTIFGGPCSGSKLKIYKEDVISNITTIFSDPEITIIKLTPSHLKIASMLDGNLNKNLKTIIIGGEELESHTIKKFIDKYGKDMQIHNEYGPTEATVGCCDYIINLNEIESKPVPIGNPIWNTKILIMDQDEICGVGIPGEICILGTCVAKGYYNLPELTREHFKIEPNTKLRMYRTGDLGRFNTNGILEYLGRLDDQVKIRGYRIELSEINTVVQSFSGIKDSIVISKKNKSKDPNLVVYFVENNYVSFEELANFLESKLPSYMIPTYYCKVKEFPQTLNGKIDKNLLPKNVHKISYQYCKPRTQLETKICKIVQDVLSLNKVGIKDNLIRIGGNSLKLLEIVNKIDLELGYKIPISHVFDHPTIEEFVPFIVNNDINHLKKADEKDEYPLSPSQRMIYFSSIEDEESTRYNMPIIIEINGEFNIDKIKSAFQNLVDETEILRTSFILTNGVPMQKVHSSANCKFEYIETFNNRIYDSATKSFVQPFKLNEPSLIRLKIIKYNVDSYYMLLDWHHLIGDGISVKLLFERLFELYKGDSKKQLKWHYKDYSEWINKHNNVQDKLYWQSIYKTIPELIKFPFSRNINDSDKSATTIRKKINPLISSQIRDYAKSKDISEFMFLLSGVLILLNRYTKQSDLVIGVPSSGRVIPETENLIGMFVNTLPLRFKIDKLSTCNDFFHYVKSVCLNSFEHQNYPFEKIAKQINLDFQNVAQPFLNTMFTYNNIINVQSFNIPNVDIKIRDIDLTETKFDLTISINLINDYYEIVFEYRTGMFDERVMSYMIDHLYNCYLSLLDSSSNIIDNVNVCTLKEKNMILSKFTNREAYFDVDVSLSEIISNNSIKFPDKTAVVYLDQHITYKQLEELSNSCAYSLQINGIEEGDKVAIICNKNIETIVLFYAIIKIGAVYVPIDSKNPINRIQMILNDCNPKLIINSASEITNFSPTIDIKALMVHQKNPVIKNKKNISRLAYIIYTSGTTGSPKGVMVSERNILSLVYDSDYTDLNNNMITAQTGSLAFDASTFEIWATLVHGGELHILDEELLLDIRKMKQYIIDRKVSTMFLTVSLFNQYIANEISMFDSIKYLMVGGEKVSVSHINQLLQYNKKIKLSNAYGPTETTTFALSYKINKQESSIPIGKTIKNVQAYIVNSEELCGIGLPGELYLGGSGVAMGYLNQPTLTKNKFIKNPYAKGLVYKTGDLCMWREDGMIEYLGRLDNQVKIHGYRIELEDIEAAIRKIPKIKDAIVILKETETGEKQIICFYISDQFLNINFLVKSLRELIPQNMIPKAFIRVDNIPLTINGKVDKQLLLTKFEKNSIAIDRTNTTSTDLEKEIIKIFKTVLNVNDVSTTCSFYELGGSSIDIIKLISFIHSKFGVNISVKDVMRGQNIKNIANTVGKLLNQNNFTIINKSVNNEKNINNSELKELKTYLDKIENKQKNIVGVEYKLNKAQLFCYDIGAKTCKIESNIINHSSNINDEDYCNIVWKKAITRFPILNDWINLSESSKKIISNLDFDTISIPLFDISKLDKKQQINEINIFSEFIQQFLEKLILRPIALTVAFKVNSKEILLLSIISHIVFDGVSGQILQDYIENVSFKNENNNKTSDYKNYVDFFDKTISPNVKREFYQVFELDKFTTQVKNQNKKIASKDLIMINHKVENININNNNLYDLFDLVESAWIRSLKYAFGLEELAYFTLNVIRKTKNYDFTNDVGLFLQFIPHTNSDSFIFKQTHYKEKFTFLYNNDLSSNHILFADDEVLEKIIDTSYSFIPVLNNTITLGNVAKQITGFEKNSSKKCSGIPITNIYFKDNTIYFEGLLTTLESENSVRSMLSNAFQSLNKF